LDSPFFFDGTSYWSEGDEQAHFDWLDRIACVREARGRGTRVFLTINPNDVTPSDLRELIAIYRRYGGDLEQLKILEETTDAPNP
jgi:hypothetical protein